MDLLYALIAGGTGAGGAYGGVWIHLKWHLYRLDEQKEMLKEHDKLLREIDKRTSACKNCNGVHA